MAGDGVCHVVVFGERHLRNLLRSYQTYYNECRTHLSLSKDAPHARTVQVCGRIAVRPVLGGMERSTPSKAGEPFRMSILPG